MFNPKELAIIKQGLSELANRTVKTAIQAYHLEGANLREGMERLTEIEELKSKVTDVEFQATNEPIVYDKKKTNPGSYRENY